MTIVCPPAGLAVGVIYTTIDAVGAVKGEDLISGIKLSDEERMMRGAFAIVPGAGALAAKSLLKHMPAIERVMKTVSKTMDDDVKPIKSKVHPIDLKGKQSIETAITNTKKQVSPVISNLKPGKQSIIPGVKTAEHQNDHKIPTKSKFTTKIEHAKQLGKAHVDQMKFDIAHPIIATVTSKAGQKCIRGSAEFIDNAFKPAHIKNTEVIGGPEYIISRVQVEKKRRKYT